jgi:hypothetical protein
VKPEQTTDPIIDPVTDIDAEQPLRIAVEITVVIQQRPVAAVVIDVRITPERDPDRTVNVDLDREPFFRLPMGQALLKALRHHGPDLVDRDIVVRELRQRNRWRGRYSLRFCSLRGDYRPLKIAPIPAYRINGPSARTVFEDSPNVLGLCCSGVGK